MLMTVSVRPPIVGLLVNNVGSEWVVLKVLAAGERHKRLKRGGIVDWEKASQELNDILAQVAEPFALVEKRKMFGGLCLFLSGHMFAGVHGHKIVLRLGEADRSRAESEADALPFEPMPGRVMREYVVVPESVWSDPDSFDQWIRRSVEFVGTLPPKTPKPKKALTAEGGAR
jgi:TfoX/Sxy family transcriptional regulator of competence genes